MTSEEKREAFDKAIEALNRHAAQYLANRAGEARERKEMHEKERRLKEAVFYGQKELAEVFTILDRLMCPDWRDLLAAIEDSEIAKLAVNNQWIEEKPDLAGGIDLTADD